MLKSVTMLLLAMMVGFASAGPKISFVQGYSFDPLAERCELPVSLTVDGYEGGYGYYLIQFKGPIQDEWKKAVERAGAELLWYLPQYAFISRVQADRVDEVRDMPRHPKQ